MKKVLFLSLPIVLIMGLWFRHLSSTLDTECDVAEFYEGFDPESGTKVLVSFGNVEEAQLLLVPTRMEEGSFEVDLSRKGDNLYKIEGTNYYVETRFCLELALYDKAMLKVDSNFGLTKGKVVFK